MSLREISPKKDVLLLCCKGLGHEKKKQKPDFSLFLGDAVGGS